MSDFVLVAEITAKKRTTTAPDYKSHAARRLGIKQEIARSYSAT